MQLRKSQTEKYMGRKLSLYTNRDGTAWLVSDGQMLGPFDTIDDAARAMERQKILFRLAFYARTHHERRRRP
jgi:hypothetical protein